MNTPLLLKTIEDKTIVWFSGTDNYLVLEPMMAEILQDMANDVPLQKISEALAKQIDIPFNEASDFVNNACLNLFLPNTEQPENTSEFFDLEQPLHYSIKKHYRIDDKYFEVSYKDEFEAYLIHPKLSHLETDNDNTTNFSFQIYTKGNRTFLFDNTEFIGVWDRKNIHYMQGKFSMKLVEKLHNKPEDEWLGVFHASGVSNGKKSMLFLGDSGNGKSTSLALLQANGFTCLADDFVPMAADNRHIYSFPSGISIKKNSLTTLLPLYPELEDSAEFHFKTLNKIVRFLKPNNTDHKANLPCKDLVFITYDKTKSIDLQCNKISKIDAFQKLIPDSWVSKHHNNVTVFLEWFSQLNAYELTYSDNQKMITTVQNLFDNDL